MRKMYLFTWLIISSLFLLNINYALGDSIKEKDFLNIKKSLQYINQKNFEYRKIEKNIVYFLQGKINKEYFKKLQYKNLDFVGDKIRLEVILTNEEQLNSLSKYSSAIEIENHYKSLAQILIPTNQILDLSKENYVQYIRSPVKPIPTVTSEGVGVIGADLVQADGCTGAGVKVAVIDLGFEGYASNPELPLARIKETISYRADHNFTYDDHGTACAEIILDVAPQVDLYLYNFDTISELNSAVSRAISVGVDVISFSISYFSINNYDGIGYSGIGDVCGIVNNARSHGILFVVPIGNYAEHHYEGTWIDSNSNDWHEFSGSDEGIDLGYLYAGTYYHFELTWNDWPYSDQDYALVLYDNSLNPVDWSTNYQTGSQPPNDYLSNYIAYSDYYYLCILNVSATQSVDFELYELGETFLSEYVHPESSLTCPADSSGATSVGAIFWDSNTLEDFSSRGPTNDGRTKPDVTAPDGVTTYTYGAENFYGTSASTPHVAGAAALLLSAGPLCSPSDLQNLLETQATDLGDTGKDNLYGSGRINVWSAYNYMKPKANFTYSPLNPTTANTIQFTDTSVDSDGTINSWLWNFGDGGTSTQKNPTHRYTNNGNYTVTLKVIDDDGANGTINKTVTVTNLAPTANFTYSPSYPTTATTIQFTDTSTDSDGTINSWSWSFGDEGTSNQKNPTHKYDDDGIYNITLNATDDDNATGTISRWITVNNTPPVANYTYSPSDIKTIDTIQFNDTSTDSDGVINSWSWNFGDGNTSTSQNISHKYTYKGTYQVNLTVTDDDGATNTKSKSIIVNNTPPQANFTFYPNNPEALVNLNFFDTSLDTDGFIVSCYWSFGDGNTSTLQNPTHKYLVEGNYSVSLTVTDNESATDIETKTITVMPPVYYNITGTIYYNGSESKPIYVVIFDDFFNESQPINYTIIYSPGNYVFQVTNGTYYIGAWLDVNNNSIYDDGEPAGLAINKSIYYSPDQININGGDENNVDINLFEMYKLSGEIFYNGTKNGLIYVMVFDQIPVEETPPMTSLNISSIGEYSFWLTNGTYYLSAFMDINSDTQLNITSEPMGWAINNTFLEWANLIEISGTYQTNIYITLYDPFIPKISNVISNPVLQEGSGYVNISCNITTYFGVSDVYLNITHNDAWENFSIKNNETDLIYYCNKTYTDKGTYSFTIWVNDTVGNINTSETNYFWICEDIIEHQLTGGKENIDLLDEMDLNITINTSSSNNITFVKYADNPYTGHQPKNGLNKFIDIIIEDPEVIIPPINITLYYTQDDLDQSGVNEDQLLGVYFWDENIFDWELFNVTGVNVTYNENGYEGFCWVEAWHLTPITLGGDSQPPSKVTGLTVKDAKDGKLDLSWNPAIDNVAISHYKIYRDGQFLINVTQTSYQDTGLTNGQTYTYQVSAVDTSGNEGEKSDQKTGKPTKSSSGGGGGGGGGGGLPPNNIPVADANGPYNGIVNTIITFDGSRSNDFDGTIISYDWNFGDGETEKGVTITHLYSAVGNYTVKLTVTDDVGQKDTDTTYAVIIIKQNSAPNKPSIYGNQTGKTNIKYNYTVVSIDEDNDNIKYSFDWGDQTTIIVTDFENSSISYTVMHSWASPGVYTIKVNAVDEHNSTSETAELVVLIDTLFCDDKGYIIDTDSDGGYDLFHCNTTGNETNIKAQDGNYLIDTDGDGKWDYTFNLASGLSVYQEEEEKTPGFELILLLCTIALLLFLKRKRKLLI